MNRKENLIKNIRELSNDCFALSDKFRNSYDIGKRNYSIALGGIMASTISSFLLNINVVTGYQKLLNTSLILNIFSVASIPWLYRFGMENNNRELLLSKKFDSLRLRVNDIIIGEFENKNVDAKIKEYEKLRDEFLEERNKNFVER